MASMVMPTQVIVDSVPALAAALRTTGKDAFRSATMPPLAHRALAPMYQVRDASAAHQADDAVQLVEQVSDRLRRLAKAYGAWRIFDVGAYFDLTDAQAQMLVKVTERVSTVHVRFRTDLLLPAFQGASAYWADHFTRAHAAFGAAYRHGLPDAAHDDEFLSVAQPAMCAHWQQLLAIVTAARHTLADSPGYWSVSALQETHLSLQRYWTIQPAQGIDPTLTPPLTTTPTLSLSIDFPLPAHRQPGRLRRLRTNRDRRRMRHGRNSSRENPQ